MRLANHFQAVRWRSALAKSFQWSIPFYEVRRILMERALDFALASALDKKFSVSARYPLQLPACSAPRRIPAEQNFLIYNNEARGP